MAILYNILTSISSPSSVGGVSGGIFMPNQESVLWYCPDPVLFSAARKAFAIQGVRVRPVSPEQTGETVGHL